MKKTKLFMHSILYGCCGSILILPIFNNCKSIQQIASDIIFNGDDIEIDNDNEDFKFDLSSRETQEIKITCKFKNFSLPSLLECIFIDAKISCFDKDNGKPTDRQLDVTTGVANQNEFTITFSNVENDQPIINKPGNYTLRIDEINIELHSYLDNDGNSVDDPTIVTIAKIDFDYRFNFEIFDSEQQEN